MVGFYVLLVRAVLERVEVHYFRTDSPMLCSLWKVGEMHDRGESEAVGQSRDRGRKGGIEGWGDGWRD